MKYVGGPKDGLEVEDTHAGAKEVQISVSYYAEDRTPIGIETSLYSIDSFGCMMWRGVLSQTDLR